MFKFNDNSSFVNRLQKICFLLCRICLLCVQTRSHICCPQPFTASSPHFNFPLTSLLFCKTKFYSFQVNTAEDRKRKRHADTSSLAWRITIFLLQRAHWFKLSGKICDQNQIRYCGPRLLSPSPYLTSYTDFITRIAAVSTPSHRACFCIFLYDKMGQIILIHLPMIQSARSAT